MRALLAALALFAALAACEPATFHFVNVFPGDSVMMNATVTSPSFTNIKIGNIGFGQTHQPFVLASGALGQAVITTTSSSKYFYTKRPSSQELTPTDTHAHNTYSQTRAGTATYVRTRVDTLSSERHVRTAGRVNSSAR